MNDKVEIDIGALKDEIARLQSDFAGLRERFARKLANGAETLAETIDGELNDGHISARLAALEKQFEAAAGRVKAGGKEAVHKLESEVTERPLASLAVAFGIGLLAAQLLRR